MKTTLKTFICFLLISLFGNVSAQDGTFEYVLTGKNEPIGFKQLDDNSSIAVSNRTNSSPNEISVLRVSNQAQLLWSKIIKLSPNLNSLAYDFIVDRDKNIVIVGSIQTSSSFILKLNGNDGSVIFSKTIVNNNNFASNRYYRIIQMNSGYSDDYVLTGSLNQPSTHSVARVDKNGNTIWAKEYDVSGGNELTYAVVQAFDGDIILGCNMSNGSHFDQGVIKLNPSNGNVKMLHKFNFSYNTAFNGGFDAGVAITGTKLVAFTLHLNGNSNPTREGVVLYNTETQSVVNAQLYNIGFQARSFSICYDNLNGKIIIGGGYLETNNNNLFFHSIDINNLKQVKTYKLKSVDYNSFQTGFAYLSINNANKILLSGYISGKTPPITSSKVVLITHDPSSSLCTEELTTNLVDVSVPSPSTSTISLIKNYTHSNNTPIITNQTFPINKLCQEGCIADTKLFKLNISKKRDTICQNAPVYNPIITISNNVNDTIIDVTAYKKNGNNYTLLSTLKNNLQVQFNFTGLGNNDSFMFIGRRKCSLNDTVYLSLFKHRLTVNKFLQDSLFCVGEQVTMRSNLLPSAYRPIEFRWFDVVTDSTLGIADTLNFVATESKQIGLKIDDYCANSILLKTTMEVAPQLNDSIILMQESGCAPFVAELRHPQTKKHINTRTHFKWRWYINGMAIDSTTSQDGDLLTNKYHLINASGIYNVRLDLSLNNKKVCTQVFDTINAQPTLKRFNLFINKPNDTFCQNLPSYNALVEIRNNTNDSFVRVVAYKKLGNIYHAVDSALQKNQAFFNFNALQDYDSLMFVGRMRCSFNDTVYLTLYKHKLSATRIFHDSLFCIDDTIKMYSNLLPSSFRTIQYRWFDELTNMTFSNIETLEFPAFTSMTIGLEINDNCANLILLKAPILVAPLVLDSNILTKRIDCEPLRTEFIHPNTQRHFDTRLFFKWHWSIDGNSIDFTLSEDGQVHNNKPYTFDSAGIYRVKIDLKLSNQKICNTYFDTAIVYKRPIADFVFSPDVADNSDTAVRLVNRSVFADAYQWSISDGATYNSLSPSHRFQNVGDYQVELIAYKDTFCSDTTTKDFTIFDSYKIFRPSGFTPNGNGFNEVWQPYIVAAKNIELRVFNRWGEMIHYSESLPAMWDGTYKGEMVQEGIYVYLLKVVSIKKRIYYYKGTIELLR